MNNDIASVAPNRALRSLPRPEARVLGRVRCLLRALVDANAGRAIAIVIVDGGDAPRLLGQRGRFTTRSGVPVRYPNAYRRAFGRPVYHCSTLRIEVGRDWYCDAVRASVLLERAS